MQTMIKTGILSLAAALALASPARAQHSEQLVVDDVTVTSDDGLSGAFVTRDTEDVGPADEVNLFRAIVSCAGNDENVLIAGFLTDPEKILDKKTKVEIQQKGHLPIEIDGLTGGTIFAQPAVCQAKVQGLDKDKSGTLGDGADQMKVQLKCKPSLAEDLGLDEVQTAELEAAFGKKVSCSGKGVAAQL